MEHRSLGRAGLTVSALTPGAMTFEDSCANVAQQRPWTTLEVVIIGFIGGSEPW